MSFKERLKRLKNKMRDEKLDACLLMNFHSSVLDPNVYYYSGVRFLIHACVLIPIDEEPVIMVAKGDFVRVRRNSCILEVRKTENLKRDIPKLLNEFHVEKIGVCGRFFSFEMLKVIGNRKVRNIDDILYEMRMVKDDDEVKNINKAVEITKKSIEEIHETVRVGMKEREIEAKLEFIVKNKGSEGTAFPTIVLSGKRTRDPHGLTSKKKIKEGDLLLIDCGAKYGGYCSDITRVICIGGKMREKYQDVYEVVSQAQKEAIKRIKPGVTNFEVDETARRIIKEYGYDMPHGLGHGFGLEIHEEPSISYKGYKGCRKVILKEDMIFTVEPSIYLDEFGIRIEDDILVTKNGRKIL